VANEAQKLAIAALQAVGASGLSRVDLFYEEATERLLINEINTLPGFTHLSMYPMLWFASGIPLADLVHQLVELAR
jgi:D-alanine-D-alanine ligase